MQDIWLEGPESVRRYSGAGSGSYPSEGTRAPFRTGAASPLLTDHSGKNDGALTTSSEVSTETNTKPY